MPASPLDQLCVNTIRTLSIDAVQKANSGHPGMPMGTADMAYVLWTKYLKHNPENPSWFDRDRFILSAGHGSMLIYSLLHLTGYDLSLDDIKDFRQWGSKTPGHPEFGHTAGVETTTGPLGQGFATGVGMAMAEAYLANHLNRDGHNVIDHYTYGIVSDGDLMEGISHESASLAGHLKLGKIIYLYDSNNISIDGSTDLAFTEDVQKRFEAYGWHVTEIDGHNHDEISEAIEAAQKAQNQPSLIICKTHIGFGSPNKQDSASSHGAPLGEDEIKLTKEAYGWDYNDAFHIPEEALSQFRNEVEKGKQFNKSWIDSVEAFANVHPELAKDLDTFEKGQLPDTLSDVLPVFESDGSTIATRKASGAVLNSIADVLPNLIGGSADLAGSNNTTLSAKDWYDHAGKTGQNVHYGVREHAMAAAMNGMALHGGVIPYGGTFFVFTDYMRPAIRLAALMGVQSIHVLTHDSIGLGEDGPTHQPIEHLASLRAMPNCVVIRPADANETAYAWKHALERQDGPTLLVLTRQNLPIYERNEDNSASELDCGAYILSDSVKETPDSILLATGSEVEIIMEAKEILKEKNIDARVVSMPSWEIFESQESDYHEKILPSNVKSRVAIEAGSTFGWSRWVGDEGVVIGIDHFGASAPYQTIYKKFGLTSEAVVEAVLKQLS